MTPEIRERKHRSIQSVINVAVHFHKAGQWDAYCDSITKLLGMADAFSGLDDDLYNHAMDGVNALSRFILEHKHVDFDTWAATHASNLVRAGA